MIQYICIILTVKRVILLKIKNKEKNSRFSRFTDNWIYVILAFLCSAVLMILVYYCYEIIPFGGRTVLRMDLFHQYGPLFAEFYDRLTQFKSFLYSWNTGGGGAFLGNYFNYLSSPVGDLIALVAGHSRIPEAIGVMVLIKNALAASTLAYYLKRKFGRNDFSIAAFGLMYAFCGFFIAYYWNIMWIDAMYILPLVVLGIENIINERKCRLYVIALAFSFFANYYMSYMICIFAIFYFLVHFISTCAFKDRYGDIPVKTDENGNEKSTTFNKIIYNRFLRSGVLFAASSVLAVAVVAFALIPTYFCLKSCSATSGTFPAEPEWYNSIFDFLANHIASLEPTIRSSGDTVLPNVYCGILTVILVPLYLFCDKISAKAKAAHIVLLGIFFLGFNLNMANYVLHAFHFPNDLPFRFSFIYSFFLVTMAYEVLVHIKSFSAKAIVGTGAGVILFTVLVEKLGMENVDDATVYTTIGFVALYTIVLCLMRKKEYAQSAVALLLMCSVFAEVAVADIDHFSITQEKVNFVNGYTDFRNLKNKLDEKEGNDTYRLEVTDINTLMDASWFDYNGISVFSSMAYEKSANFQNQFGLDSNYINSYIYYAQTPVYNAMMGLKYIVNSDSEIKLNEKYYKHIADCGKFSAYENNYYLPIGFCVNTEMPDMEVAMTDPFAVQNDFWYYATGLYGVLDQIHAADSETDNIEPSESYLEDSFTAFKQNTDGEGTLRIKFQIPEDENVYLYFDAYDVDTLTVTSESGEFSKNQSIDEPYILDCGLCKKDEILTVEFTLDGETDSCSAECYMYGLDEEQLDKGYEIVKKNVLNVEEFKETYIKGTVTVPENKMLFTSINYDSGWTVLVDGKETQITKIGDALIGINMPAGEHMVEFKYMPDGLLMGLIISAAALVILILFTVLNKFRGKRIRKSQHSPKADFKAEADAAPKGIEAMMAEDIGKDATVEDAESLLEPVDIYEGQLEKNAEGLSKMDEILHTQKLDLKAILEAAEKGISEEDK